MSEASDREKIEQRIAELVRNFASAPNEVVTSGVCDQVLQSVTDQALTSSEGGKRLRALLTIDAYHALGGHDEAIVDLACAIEVFQTGALVHDDIIDDSDLRRGKPSAHKALGMQSSNASLGVGLGIMLGDLLATASVDIATCAARQLGCSDTAISAFLTMHREVETGQVLDLAAALCPLDNPEQLADTALTVYRWKTASYTTIAPLELALLAAGMDARQARSHAVAVGEPLGLAFQLADDLLDVVGSSSNTGKPVGGDIREGKRTVLLADALTQASDSDNRQLASIFAASERSEEQVSRTIELFESTGAIAQSRKRITALWTRSQAAIADMELRDSESELLTTACARFIPMMR